MCGIFSMVTPASNGFSNDDMQAMQSAFFLTQLRGKDSTGIAVVDNDKKAWTLKALGGPGELADTKEWPELRSHLFSKGKLVFAHGRAATRGSVKLENAHPFIMKKGDEKDDAKKIILVHNGTLTYHQTLPGFHKHDVDSSWLAHCIATLGPEETLAKVEGAIATIWWDTEEKRLYWFRNHERPLSVAVSRGVVYTASEDATLAYMKAKHRLPYDYKDILDFTPRMLCWVDFDDLKNLKSVDDIQAKEIKKVYPTYSFPPARKEWGGYPGLTDDEEDLVWGVKSRRYRPPIVHEGRSMMTDMEDLLSGRLISVEFQPDGKRLSRWKRVGMEPYTSEDYRAPYEKDLVKMQLDLAAPDTIVKTYQYMPEGTFQIIRVKWKTEAVAALEKKPEPSPEQKVLTFAQKEEDLPVQVTFRPNGKFKFRTKSGRTTEIYHKGVCAAAPYFLTKYENSVDGRYTIGQPVFMEVHQPICVGHDGTGKKIYRVDGFEIQAKDNGEGGSRPTCVDVYFYTSMFNEKEIEEINFFSGEIASMRLVNSTKHADTGGYVELCLRDVIPAMMNEKGEIEAIDPTDEGEIDRDPPQVQTTH